MRIAVVHDWEPDFHQEMTQQDGIFKAIKLLGERHEVRVFTMGQFAETWPHPYFSINVCCSGEDMKRSVQHFEPDVILHWADCTRPNAAPLAELGIPMALCFAGGDPNGPTAVHFDHFFVENEIYKGMFEAAGKSVSVAFGTNTELFTPLPDMQKQFDVIFPATYCEWKRHHLFREAVRGLRAVCAGYMYADHERDCWEDTMKAGVLTLPHVSADVLRTLYAASRVCVITSKASGGSQRTVLEAMSMNIPVVITEDGKGAEYLHDAYNNGYKVQDIGELAHANAIATRIATNYFLNNPDEPKRGREYVLSKWSEYHYADALEKGLQALL